MQGRVIPLDAPFYTEDELDALYETDPMEALRISRRQALLRRQLEAAGSADPDAAMPTREQLTPLLQKIRQVLLQDGGDLELVGIEGSTVRVRMKGACVGCPRSVLDLKNVVEKAIRQQFPQVREVANTF
jgi:Fe-S cluster biogenesis protein NfuA